MKEIKSRIILKHDNEINWNKASSFIPKQGEVIIYDIDDNYTYERMKIGDGITNVIDLPFIIQQADWNENDETKAGYIKNKPELSKIINVATLPESGNENALYRLITGTLAFNKDLQYGWKCYSVSELPETGDVVADLEMSYVNGYYNITDGIVYGYVDNMLGSALGIPSSWYDFNTLLSGVGYNWGGVVTSIEEMTLENTFYLLLSFESYTYKNGWLKTWTIGRRGTGAGAEVFNHPSNIASGESSHAEGNSSHAEGYSSHAEGYTHAEGDYSHAEGSGSHAEGNSSHAEGNRSHAEGNSSHAEGDYSHAEGHSSHAEGNRSYAEGYSSHAEGRGYTIYRCITGIANATSYTIDDISNLFVGANIRYNIYNNNVPTYKTAKIMNIDTVNKTITVNRTLSEESALDNADVMIYLSGALGDSSHTEGIYTIAGLKGFWYKAVDTTNKVIYLTNERTMTEDGIYYTWLNQESEAESLNYSDNAVGKLLSVCNDEKFEYALKITSLEPGKIYYELVGDDDPFKTQEQISVDEVNRDDFSVWCHDCYNEGNVDLGYAAHAEGSKSKATNKVAHAEGMYTHAYGQFSHAEGSETRADYAAHAEGRGTEALAVYAHSEGYFTKAIGNGSHAEGKRTTAYASQSHAEGSSSIAMGLRSHAEGTGNVASSQLNGIDLPKLSTSAVRKLWEEAKYTDGDGVEQTATYTDINGVEQTLEVKSLNIAVGESSHVEGSNNLAYGEHSHAEGYKNIAFGVRSHAEGNKTTANGLYSHTEGWYSIANGDYQHVQGKYNIEDTENKYANIIGNGKSLTKRSNAHTVDWNGNAWYAGDVYTGGTGQDDTATKKLATEEYVTQQLTSVNGYKIEVMSESQYANLGVYDASTLYFCYK